MVLQPPRVAILAAPEDPCANAVEARLLGQAAKVYRFPRIGGAMAVELPAHGSPAGYMAAGSQRVRLDDLDSVLVRPWTSRRHEGETFRSADERYVDRELEAVESGLLASLACLVVNRMRPGQGIGRGGFGLRERKVATRLGIALPPCLATSSPEAAIGFFERSSCRVWVEDLSAHQERRLVEGPSRASEILEVVGTHPVLLTSCLEGRPLSWYVIGDRALGDSPAEPIAGSAVRLARALSLEFAELRFVTSPDGSLECVDVDGTPDLPRAEPLRSRIVAALAELLASANGRPAG